MTKINVVDTDIGEKEVNTLITAIKPNGEWHGDIDEVIKQCADNMYHTQAHAAMPLQDGQLVFAEGTASHLGEFKNVLFISDDLQQPLYDLVTSALKKAESLGIESVSIPALRTGLRSDQFEDRREAINALADAVSDFDSEVLTTIYIVTYQSNSDRLQIIGRLTERSQSDTTAL